jgi:ribonucleoside-diphosphate reductase alpha chain
MDIQITKADGTKAPFNADLINRSIERACQGMVDPVAMVTQIATETRVTLYDGISTEELDQATINAAIQNVKEDIQYDKVATRLLLKTIYRKVIGDYDKDSREDLRKKHREGFINYIKQGIANNRLHPNMEKKYNLEELADTLDIRRDDIFLYAGLDGMMNRYSLKDAKQQPLETPQYLFMRIAMGLSYNEEDPTAWAKKFYAKMSKHEYMAGGSTNIGAGTLRPALSNCFLLEIQDDMENIAKSVADVMLLSKGSGGLGASITKLRASGSPLKSNFGGASTGPTPFAKIIDTAIRAIARGGKKKGALCFYMENWHIDFPEFIEWKHNAGDDYMRMRTANTAAFISDEFMKRVKVGDEWYMFDPAETPDLCELYGSAFSKRYAEYVDMANAGSLRAFKKVPAIELFRQMLVSLQTTSHPWLTWKDPINLRALNNNTGTIHMSNLCTEICLPQDRENTAVCNLASLNLAAHISHKEINWTKLEESVRLAVHQLDNLIDINMLPIKEAVKSDKENRAVGLGVMGFADTIEQLGMAYDSDHAADFADRVFEFISYMAIDESANLAETRGSYSHFVGSRWSQGMVPIDTIDALEKDRGIKVTVAKESRHRGLNWDVLREKVKKGMRNATLMAVAPNANIGLIVGTTPGIDPRFAQVFSRNKISGKYMDINHNLVKDLMNMGIWEKTRESIIESQGDISGIDAIPDHLKNIYKTSFTTSPYGFIEVAARAQKWIDQALSRNMYLETRDIEETIKIYTAAWEKGVKTTYYLHMKPRHTAEQSTVQVNKATKMGKKGFGSVASVRAEIPEIPQPIETNVVVGEPVLVPMNEMEMPTPLEMSEDNSAPVSSVSVSSTVSSSLFGLGSVASSERSEKREIASAVATKEKETVSTSVAFAAEPAVKVAAKYQSLQSLASQSAALPQMPVKKRPKVCPTDPAELAQCDSCQ